MGRPYRLVPQQSGSGSPSLIVTTDGSAAASAVAGHALNSVTTPVVGRNRPGVSTPSQSQSPSPTTSPGAPTAYRRGSVPGSTWMVRTPSAHRPATGHPSPSGSPTIVPAPT